MSVIERLSPANIARIARVIFNVNQRLERDRQDPDRPEDDGNGGGDDAR